MIFGSNLWSGDILIFKQALYHYIIYLTITNCTIFGLIFVQTFIKNNTKNFQHFKVRNYMFKFNNILSAYVSNIKSPLNSCLCC